LRYYDPVTYSILFGDQEAMLQGNSEVKASNP
jgi:hypothetical protein